MMEIARGTCGSGAARHSFNAIRRTALVLLAGAVVAGCAECRHDVYSVAPAAAVPIGPGRRAAHAAANTATEQTPVAPGRLLKPRNAAKFALLPDMEAVGRSRSYNGGQTDPDACAEQCLANKGCDAFSFEKTTRLCYLVTDVTELAANASFISGRLR